jgi:hypothetical protein
VYLTTAASYVPAEACLQLTGRLLQEAQICARNEAPAVYSIAQLLLDHPDEMVELIKGERHHAHFKLRSEVFMVRDWVMVFWVMMPCNEVIGYQHFRGPCCLHLEGEVNS